MNENENEVMMSEEDRQTISDCMGHLFHADVMATLIEMRSDDNETIRRAEIDRRITTASINKLMLLDQFAIVDMKFKVDGRHDAMSFRSFFQSYADRKTEIVRKQLMKDYDIMYDFIYANEEEKKIYRTTFRNPVMSLMEEVNDDFILHTIVPIDNLDFLIDDYDPFRVQGELQYMQVMIEEQGNKGSSSSSEIDDDGEDEEDSYFIDNM